VGQTLRYTALLLMAFSATAWINEMSIFHSTDGKQTGLRSSAGFGIIRGAMAIGQYNN
jgi:hypothetical protein